MRIAAADLPHFKTLADTKTPSIMRTVFLAILVGVVLTGIFLAYVPWVQTTSGAGTVTALDPDDRQQEVNALVSGRIEEWFVRDGSAVKKGDPIVRISDVDPQLIQRLQAERAQMEVQLAAAESGLANAATDRNRMRQLFDEGLVARRDYEQAQIRVDEFEGRVAEARAALTRVDVNLSRQSEQTVFAPRDGFIQSLNAGDTATLVSAGDPVATFVPEDTQRIVEVFIDGRDVALVQIGAETRVQFEGWPAVQFSGWPAVAVGVFEGRVMAVDPSAQPDGRFRVLIAEPETSEIPWPEERFVRFGAKVRAWILLDTVPVGYELWRQLNNFPPQLPSQGQTTQAGATQP